MSSLAAVGSYTGIIPIGTFSDVATVRNTPEFVGTIFVAIITTN